VVALESGESLVTLNAGDTADYATVSSDSLVPALPNAIGEQRTLVIMVNFQNNPSSIPWGITEVDSAFFGKVNEFFLENSYDQTSLTGDTYGWYTIPLDSTVCDMMQIESAARSAAAAAGADLSAYDHHVYVFPKTSSCSWSGTSTVGGNPSRTWINGDLNLQIVGHELGHGMGLYHSHSLVCQDAVIGTDCTKREYGDGLDIMGNSLSAHFNAFQKERLGWLNSGISPPITTVDADGIYELEPYASTGAYPKALKVFKGIDPATGKKVWYYIEYRQAVGFDSVIASPQSAFLDSSNILNGVVIHTGSPEESGNTSYLLDMTPETYYLYTTDPALIVGQSFYDPESGVTITTRWADGNTAGVEVSVGTAPTPPVSTNEPPVAVDDSDTTIQDSPVTIPILANDWDPDGDPLNVVSVTQGANGKVSINSNGTVIYVPNPRFSGNDAFEYQVTDGADSAIGRVAVKVDRTSPAKGGGKKK